MSRCSALLVGLKAKLEAFAGRPEALYVLFGIAFLEAALVPVPPDILFVALAVAHPSSSFRYAAVCIAGSVAGAMLGYGIGMGLSAVGGESLLSWLGLTAQFEAVLRMYRSHAVLALIIAGFTNIPFSLFAIAAGFRQTVDPLTFFLGALAGRTIRFMLVGLLLFFFGPSVKRAADRYLPAVSFAIIVLFVITMLALPGGRP